MGLFGLFYAVFAVTSIAAGRIKEAREDKLQKKKSVHNRIKTYYDHRGVERLVENEHMVLRTTDSIGDSIIKDVHTGRIVSNQTQNRRYDAIESINRSLSESNSNFSILGTVSELYNGESKFRFFHNDTIVYLCKDDNKRYMRECKSGSFLYWIDIDTFECVCLNDGNTEMSSEWCENHNRVCKEMNSLPFDVTYLDILVY